MFPFGFYKLSFEMGLFKNGQWCIIGIDRSGQRRKHHEEKFYDLPIEKQQTILNAGYRIFSQNA